MNNKYKPYLKGRCFALPFMMPGYQVVNFMNAVDKGKLSFLLAIIRNLIIIKRTCFVAACGGCIKHGNCNDIVLCYEEEHR